MEEDMEKDALGIKHKNPLHNSPTISGQSSSTMDTAREKLVDELMKNTGSRSYIFKSRNRSYT